jgi:hypothetical protein
MNKDKDYVFYTKNNKLYGGGYEIASVFNKLNIPTMNKNGLPSLSIPSTLYYNSQTGGGLDFVQNEHSNNFSENSLYDKLLNQFILSDKKMTMKRRKKRRKKTRKRI